MGFEIIRIKDTEGKVMAYEFERVENLYKIFFVVGVLMFAVGIII